MFYLTLIDAIQAPTTTRITSQPVSTATTQGASLYNYYKCYGSYVMLIFLSKDVQYKNQSLEWLLYWKRVVCCISIPYSVGFIFIEMFDPLITTNSHHVWYDNNSYQRVIEYLWTLLLINNTINHYQLVLSTNYYYILYNSDNTVVNIINY